jgi:ATP-binding cassette subfamily F protein uup
VLLLDEPTNDLDIPTLEVLEESLLEFPGALVLVTHDRYLLDRVSTRLLALDGQGGAVVFADYAQWEMGQQASARSGGSTREKEAPTRGGSPDEKATADKPRRLSYIEQREWERMEKLILEAEQVAAAGREAAADPRVASDHQALADRHASLAVAEAKVELLYARWAELEAKMKA